VSWRRYCATPEETIAAGLDFAHVLKSGDIVLLTGTLGAGKTTFTKGVASGLGVVERVTSPTFTMVREHHCANDQGIETLHHCDVYRVATLDEVIDLALGELVEDAAVALVEWGELAASVFGRDVLTVDFEIDDDEGRTLVVAGDPAHSRAVQLDAWATP
jgi:tRNA threonylcarbamoyladenosine biosynthesis protein TsaE